MELQYGDPREAGVDPDRLEGALELVRHAVLRGDVPGAVALVARRGKILAHVAEGYAALWPEARPLTLDTRFDLASLTKAVATAPAVWLLVERGELSLDDPVGRYLGALAQGDKAAITVLHLLTHTSGLVPTLDFHRDVPADREEAVRRIAATPLVHGPGQDVLYSDLGYLLLGWVVEQVSGQRLDRFCQDHLFGPLGLAATGFCPDPSQVPCAATERIGDDVLCGVVHDPNARALGGVCGHAGLFSTALDLALFAQMLLAGGKLRGRQVLAPATVRAMTRVWAEAPAGGALLAAGSRRTAGWEAAHPGGASGDLLSPRAFGHTGFTGTSLWVDPELELIAVLLTNRVHPSRASEAHLRLRPRFHNRVAAAVVEVGS